MIESDIFKPTATEHHGKHHRTPVSDVHPGGGDSHVSDSAHGADEQSHHEEESEPEERKPAMKNRKAPTFTALALAVVTIISLSVGNKVNAATITSAEIRSNITTDIPDDITIRDITGITRNTIGINIVKEDIAQSNININTNINESIATADNINLIIGAADISRITNVENDDIMIGNPINVSIIT
jgi:hypothetical protein